MTTARFPDASWDDGSIWDLMASCRHLAAGSKPGVTIDSEADLPDTEEELLADFVYWEEEVEAGDTQTFAFTAPPAGEYQVICAIDGHFAAGMEGMLTVSAPEA